MNKCKKTGEKGSNWKKILKTKPFLSDKEAEEMKKSAVEFRNKNYLDEIIVPNRELKELKSVLKEMESGKEKQFNDVLPRLKAGVSLGRHKSVNGKDTKANNHGLKAEVSFGLNDTNDGSFRSNCGIFIKYIQMGRHLYYFIANSS